MTVLLQNLGHDSRHHIPGCSRHENDIHSCHNNAHLSSHLAVPAAAASRVALHEAAGLRAHHQPILIVVALRLVSLASILQEASAKE
jgi:hypothetical protein